MNCSPQRTSACTDARAMYICRETLVSTVPGPEGEDLCVHCYTSDSVRVWEVGSSSEGAGDMPPRGHSGPRTVTAQTNTPRGKHVLLTTEQGIQES